MMKSGQEYKGNRITFRFENEPFDLAFLWTAGFVGEDLRLTIEVPRAALGGPMEPSPPIYDGEKIRSGTPLYDLRLFKDDQEVDRFFEFYVQDSQSTADGDFIIMTITQGPNPQPRPVR